MDMAAVRAPQTRDGLGLERMYLENFKQTGAELIFGTGRFIGPKTLEAALPGGQDSPLPRNQCNRQHRYAGCIGCVPGLADAQPLTHIEALELDQLPGHLIVIGGGYVGLEFRRRCAGSAARLPSSIAVTVC